MPGSQNFNDFKSLQSERRPLCFTKDHCRKETPDPLKGLRDATNNTEDVLGPGIKYINDDTPGCVLQYLSPLFRQFSFNHLWKTEI